jgi:AbrB family looped-hinge helix DNA binding protein
MKLNGPDGKCLYGIVKVGAKGQIVIPKEARDDHGIKPGDRLVVGGDESGIAIFTNEKLDAFFKNIIGGETGE